MTTVRRFLALLACAWWVGGLALYGNREWETLSYEGSGGREIVQVRTLAGDETLVYIPLVLFGVALAVAAFVLAAPSHVREGRVAICLCAVAISVITLFMGLHLVGWPVALLLLASRIGRTGRGRRDSLPATTR